MYKNYCPFQNVFSHRLAEFAESIARNHLSLLKGEAQKHNLVAIGRNSLTIEAGIAQQESAAPLKSVAAMLLKRGLGDSAFDTLTGENALLVVVFDLSHFGDQVGTIDQLLRARRP
jgi:hypothetical protein